MRSFTPDSAATVGAFGGAAGFTFLELVVVLAVMAVAMAVALPRLAPQVDASRLRSASAVLTGMAGMARYRAAVSGRPVAVVVHPDSALVTLAEPGANPVLVSRGLGDKVRVRFARLAGKTGRDGPVAIAFYPDGSATAAEICLATQGRETLTLDVDAATGRVRSQSGLGGKS